MSQQEAQQEVAHELGLDVNHTAGSREPMKQPLLPVEDVQLAQEQQQNKTLQPPIEPKQGEAHDGKRRSIIERLMHHDHKDHDSGKEKRNSIADSGPFIVVQNPETGHWVTKPNPHWPEEDSWKRENVRSGKGDGKVIAPGGIGGVSYF
jgi:hypothetical protein